MAVSNRVSQGKTEVTGTIAGSQEVERIRAMFVHGKYQHLLTGYLISLYGSHRNSSLVPRPHRQAWEQDLAICIAAAICTEPMVCFRSDKNECQQS